MSEKEIAEAIAEQEEYIRRWKSCGDVIGKAHRFETFRPAGSGLPVSDEDTWRACVECGVTETREDYARKRKLSDA